ncbi:uncharacterized protein BDV14DRAFT_182189 [Aspergillus stella-maris]|uniref:uncharacterized protein n=1 Tax=Aspergillus stella-maris TaxID=1810926 RepID=UPI003CCD0760
MAGARHTSDPSQGRRVNVRDHHLLKTVEDGFGGPRWSMEYGQSTPYESGLLSGLCIVHIQVSTENNAFIQVIRVYGHLHRHDSRSPAGREDPPRLTRVSNND